MWTRSFIISTASDLGDLPFVTNRLLQNPSDFADILRVFYGNEKANQFKDLFTQHILIAAELVNAAKQGDTKKVETARKNWYANADAIALFLADINPNWNQKEWQLLLYSHLKMTEAEAITRLSEKHEENVKLYDAIEDEALKMADYMYYGLHGR
ncbi:acetylglutamate kinase [Anaerotignum sp. MB30-C6]|uniref:acetylglutamate kinase n=1 Tax=Anaerotignum sp. MB30-C6 TaxID=3070814 RepID=UPI0027DE5579|nr:acetylglutamate kinase [Anaerotignum sp. MB30-C6]WMI81154.1 acetylglutamate kinase [Anaerotignum sp. MB30-C6]